MTVEQFIVQSPAPAFMNNLVISLIVIGVVLLVINVLMYSRLKNSPPVDGGRKRIGMGVGIGGTKYVLAMFGIVLILIGCILCGAVVASSSPAVVTIGEGYINVETGNAGGIGGNNNNKSVTSE